MGPGRYTAFAEGRLLAEGPPQTVAAAARAAQAEGRAQVLIFDDQSGEQVEVDPFADPPTIAGLGRPSPRPPGRPKLGVTAREVTLLPRHWDWLARQPGGASGALRRLVEAASRDGADEARRGQEAVYRVMTALGGDLPAYEAAVRALFARDDQAFVRTIASWPADVRDYVGRLARETQAGPI